MCVVVVVVLVVVCLFSRERERERERLRMPHPPFLEAPSHYLIQNFSNFFHVCACIFCFIYVVGPVL